MPPKAFPTEFSTPVSDAQAPVSELRDIDLTACRSGRSNGISRPSSGNTDERWAPDIDDYDVGFVRRKIERRYAGSISEITSMDSVTQPRNLVCDGLLRI